MDYIVSGIGKIKLETVVLDLNGTLSVNGEIVEGVKERINKLGSSGVRVVLITSDQREKGSSVAKRLRVDLHVAKSSDEKAKIMKQFDPETTAAIGNARVDLGMFINAKVRIATLQAEGIHTGIIPYVDIIVPSVNNAIDILLDKDTFISTMKK